MSTERGEPERTPADVSSTDSATASTTAKRRAPRRRNKAEVERDSRLAELVSGLTGCPPGGALHAVRHDENPESADALAVVARAMVKVDQPPPKELRANRFLRDDTTPT